MTRRTGIRAFMLLDLIVGIAISLFVGAAGIQMMQANYSASSDIGGQNNVNALARVQMDTLADSLRNAQQGPSHNVFSVASSSSIIYYTDAAGDTIRYYLNTTVSPAQLTRIVTTGGVAGTHQVIGIGVSSLTFTYYLASGSTTANPNFPLSTELPNIGAIQISAQMSISGYTSTLTSMVKLRNSPYIAPAP